MLAEAGSDGWMELDACMRRRQAASCTRARAEGIQEGWIKFINYTVGPASMYHNSMYMDVGNVHVGHHAHGIDMTRSELQTDRQAGRQTKRQTFISFTSALLCF